MPYHYYIVENRYPARIDEATLDTAVLQKDGILAPTDDIDDICTNGHEVTEADALAFWKS